MKEYLIKFRSQAFDRAIALFRRTLSGNFMLQVVTSVILLTVLVPLTLSILGWELEFYVNLSSILQGGDDIFSSLFGNTNVLASTLIITLYLLIYSWMLFMFLKLNDHEVRLQKNSFIAVLAASFSKKVFIVLGAAVLLGLIFIITAVIVFYCGSLIGANSYGSGIFLTLVLALLIIMCLLPFSLVLPAIVHGEMTIGDAFSFSLRHINFGRIRVMLLISLLLIVFLLLVTFIVNGLANFIVHVNSASSITRLIVNQVISVITNSIVGAFIYASMSAVYFRYSNDNIEDEENIERHLVDES